MSDNFTRITYEQCVNGKTSKTVIERSFWDVNTEDLDEMLRELLLGAGWQPETVKAFFNEEVEE